MHELPAGGPTSASAGKGLAQRFYDTLVALQFAPARSLQSFQDNVLRDLVTHVAGQSSFYRERLAPVIDTGGKVDLAQWHRIPVLTPADVAAHYDDLRTASIPKDHGRIFRYQSAGSTGRSLAYYRSELSELATICGQHRHFHAMGVDWSKDLALIRAFDPALQRFRERPAGSEARKETWGPKWIDPAKLGVTHHLSVFAPLRDQIAWLNGLGEIYLNTFPSHALALANHVRKNAETKPRLLAIFTAGEPITPDVRREVEYVLGCPCFDLISNAELGIMACECPSRQGYHLQSELARIELLDEQDRTVSEGQWGRVVATPLYNFALPLIRYDTGDWARLSGPCGCGRQHPLIDTTYGRPANLMRIPGPGWMRPDLSSRHIDEVLPDCRWQLAQMGPGQVELRYMRYPVNSAVDDARAVHYVKSVLGPEIIVTIREVAALGPSAGGKFSSFVGNGS